MKIRSPRVARAISLIDITKAYSVARDSDATYLHLLGAAQRHGIFEPFDAEARELNAWLTSVSAGKTLCRDAWDHFIAAADGSNCDSRGKGAG